MSRKYKFEFGEVEIYKKTINVASYVNFKQIKKDYEDAINGLSPAISEMLNRLFVKKRVNEEEINESERLELEGFFNKIAGIEEVEVLIEDEPDAGEPEKEGAATEAKEMPQARGDVKSKYILNIIEDVEYDCEHDGSIKNAEANGKILVGNSGSKDRIWDIDIELEGGKAAKIEEKKIHIDNLDAGEVWEKIYQIGVSAKEKPVLVINEQINTTPDSDDAEPCLFFIYDPNNTGEKTEFKISIENSGKKPVLDIAIEKEIAADFRDIVSLSGADASFFRESGKLKWQLERLEPGESKILGFTAVFSPNEIKTISSGDIRATYSLDSATLSGVKASFIDGLSSCIYYLDRDERDEEPDIWDVDFNFNNRSEFPMVLQRYEFHFGDENTEVKVIKNEVDYFIEPGERWESDKWTLESEDEPTCSEQILYTVYASTAEVIRSAVMIAPIELPVVSIEGTKSYDRTTVDSFRETPVGVIIEIAPKGATPVKTLIIEDTIPEKFIVSDEVELVVTIGDETVPMKHITVSYEPEGDDLSIERKMKLEINDVFDNYGELSTNKKVTLNYTVIAVNPERDLTFSAPVKFIAETYPTGSIVETVVSPDVITVTHKRRGTRVGKSISAKTEGEFEITLLYKNKGDETKRSVKISDFVPKEFELIESSMEHETQKAKNGTVITWVIDEIAPDQEIEITHSIRGQGDVYSLKNIEVKVFN